MPTSGGPQLDLLLEDPSQKLFALPVRRAAEVQAERVGAHRWRAPTSLRQPLAALTLGGLPAGAVSR